MTFIYIYKMYVLNIYIYICPYIYPRNNSPRKEFRVEAKAVGQESGSSSVFSLVLVPGKIQNP